MMKMNNLLLGVIAIYISVLSIIRAYEISEDIKEKEHRAENKECLANYMWSTYAMKTVRQSIVNKQLREGKKWCKEVGVK